MTLKGYGVAKGCRQIQPCKVIDTLTFRTTLGVSAAVSKQAFQLVKGSL
jgi:hypothetical protein